jgi:hypothetical protein
MHSPFLVNDICVHPNQGELISADQAGSIKQWDLLEDSCTHELVSRMHSRASFVQKRMTQNADARR